MGKISILVVEDESLIAKDLEMILQKLGYNITSLAASGEQAIRKAEKDKPDLVLMDIVLQGEMDGIEAASYIHSHLDIPIIYLTAYADAKTLDRAKRTEPFGYLLKPFDEKKIHATVEMALKKYKTEKEIKERKEFFSALLKSSGNTITYLNKRKHC